MLSCHTPFQQRLQFRIQDFPNERGSPLFSKMIAENCIKMKEIRSRVGVGGRGRGPPRPLGSTTGFTIPTYWQRKLTQTCSTYIFAMFTTRTNVFFSTLHQFKLDFDNSNCTKRRIHFETLPQSQLHDFVQIQFYLVSDCR